MFAKLLVPFLLSFCLATAEVATRATPVHVSPDSGSAVLHLVKTGETLPDVTNSAGLPPGWIAVSLPGPHDVFVENRFIGKDLDVKPGSPLHVGAKSTSAVLTQSTVDDKIQITGLRGRWTQLRLDQPVTGYVFDELGASNRSLPNADPFLSTPVQDSPPITSTSIQPQSNVGKAIDRTAEERQSLAALPRLFEGVLASTRSPLRPRRPYDFALETENGTRFAYLDLTRILLTTPVEKYLNGHVVVYGVARPVPDTKDIVITVESLQLR
ncbi:MAG: hypothetical protein SynsKO_27650 [Synoicihabitans sp.]